MNKKNTDVIEKLKEVFESVLGKESLESDYPKEAMPLGTFVRIDRHERLGLITDSFYGELDADGKKIILYTVLWLPKKQKYENYREKSSTNKGQYYLSNEYEYDVTGYLMLKPVDLSKLALQLGGYIL